MIIIPPANDWEAWRSLIGPGCCVVYRGEVAGFFVVCGVCEIDRPALGEVLARWDVEAHSDSPAHAVALAVLRG